MLLLWSRQRNFTLALEGATTEEAIAAERRAAFEAAEASRLQVPACCCLAHRKIDRRQSLAHCCIAGTAGAMLMLCCFRPMHCVSMCAHIYIRYQVRRRPSAAQCSVWADVRHCVTHALEEEEAAPVGGGIAGQTVQKF
jgi:hypothetical protein